MRAIGIILAGGNNHRMKELSRKRAIGAMPIAGSYRSIDFALSNMTNSHIQKVGVFTQYNARSLNEHLNSSKWWDFGRKQGGLFIFTPTVTADNSFWYRGTADAMYQNLSFLKSSHEPYVVIASGDCVYKMDYNKVLEYHIEKKADITIVCKEMPAGTNLERYGTIKMNEDSRIEELSFGSYEGMRTGGEEKDEESEAFQRFFTDTAHYIPPQDGETVPQLYERTGDFLAEICAREELQDKSILVSTHGAAMTALLNRIRGNLSVSEFWKDEVPPNCSVTEVEVSDGKPRIIREGVIYYKEKVKKWKTV